MKTFLVLALALLFSGGRAAADDQRMYPAAQLFINNHRSGDTNGFSGDLGPNGHASCGHPGHVSDVTWTLVRTSREGDVYQMVRVYPFGSADPQKETKEVTYSGKPLTVWQDDYQKIILRPKP